MERCLTFTPDCHGAGQMDGVMAAQHIKATRCHFTDAQDKKTSLPDVLDEMKLPLEDHCLCFLSPAQLFLLRGTSRQVANHGIAE